MGLRAPRLGCAAGAALLLQACVMVPVTKHEHDERCGRVVRQMTLEPVQLASIGSCSNEGCVAIVALAGATAAVSTVVSGGVAIVGNMVYWMERVGRCEAPAGSAPLPPAGGGHARTAHEAP